MPSNPIKVGVFSPNDPRPWVRSENINLMLKHEDFLVKALKSKGVKVIRGGDGFAKEDQIAWNSKLVQNHIKIIAQGKPDILIVNQGSWTFPYDSVDAVRYFQQETGDIARVVMFSYKDTEVPGLVAGMAAGGGLKRIGTPFSTCYGKIDKDKKVIDDLMEILSFNKKRAEAAPLVKKAIQQLGKQKYMAFGGMALKMMTTTVDVDQWAKIFGVSYECLDQSELVARSAEMVKWEGKPGESEFEIIDARLKKSFDYLYGQKHGKFDFSRPKLRNISKWVFQMSLYWAAVDICKEYGITFAGIKCQDELSAQHCTACLATAFMANDIGPDGKKKQIIPTACENDMDSSLTQMLLYLLSGKPAGFGDFRDVENQVLAIVNCGQHPPYFFGGPEDDSVKKLDKVEYMGQEIFYAAGGAGVRGRTPGGHTMTIARLGRENLRYQLVAFPMETLSVQEKEHDKYNPSWPIIKGKVPMTDDELIKVWPCNHLGFGYGDYTPHLAELAQRLNIGYKIYDKSGREYFKSS
jgi:L-fucose isomerase-like protein